MYLAIVNYMYMYHIYRVTVVSSTNGEVNGLHIHQLHMLQVRLSYMYDRSQLSAPMYIYSTPEPIGDSDNGSDSIPYGSHSSLFDN